MNAGWEIWQTENTEDLHVVPVDDAIEHVPDECPCGSRDEPYERADGAVFFIVIHNSLDGRELTEPGYDVPEGAKPL